VSDPDPTQQQGEARLSGACEVAVSTEPPDWSELLASNAAAGLFHDPRWGELMQRAYGNRPYYLTARQGGKIRGCLQLIHQSSALFGSRLCSLPYFDAAGILSDETQATAALLAAAAELRGALKAESVELRQYEIIDESLPARTDKVTMRLDLPADPEQAWMDLKAKVRNQIRKAQGAGLAAADGGAELMGPFYRIYVRNMRDLGSPPHSLRFFRLIGETFADRARLFVVRLGGRAIAASFTLSDRHAVHVPWAGSDYRYRGTNANMLLYWAMLTHACRSASRRFDFGRGTRDGGTYRFKKQWGGREVPLYWQHLLGPDRVAPDLRPGSPKYRLMVACWRKLPVGLVRLLGPRIISKLS